MTGQDMALRTVVPPALAQAGVTIVEQDGVRVVEIPDEVRAKFNVLLPVSEIVQADPNWTPAIRACKLNVETETYRDSNSPRGTRSANKLGLYKLATTAGLGRPETTRLQIADPNKIGWQATVTVRRSDGTLEPITQSKIVDVDVEREKVMAGVKAAAGRGADEGKPWSETGIKATFERRWLYEREHMESKC